MLKVIKKADIILMIIFLIIGGTTAYYALSSGADGKEAVISVDGKLYGRYSLSKDQTINIYHKNHINKITIKKGQVQMSKSNCHNQVCVHAGKIHKTNQTIVCLPNKVMVEIKGGKEEYDSIAE